ncbi:hypothetical protein OOT46_02500 [Aquabacterium sp. A7-Y]|uniref:hypothetical protein n=1 Tax=Aquabacterium sp. A7-Y TaxID=1349605 RepID=UPI00223CABC4|nr:hypothetical protein [Aquabacterium sp. A7-Y]MCW7536724.1 hypothetical protein [Aquabacterium sp. A7-Y]
MSHDLQTKPTNQLDEAWDAVVGGFDWLKSVLIGEFADNRSLSAVVADMLVSFVPGVVIVTSARDAVAVTLRLAQHPEKREELMEWVLLCACLITLALPLVMAAGGAAAFGVGAIVGGIAGSELGAALRAVMLMLIKQATKLIELVKFLQKFITGDILKFLRAVKFVQYEKALLQTLGKITGKLIGIVQSLRTRLMALPSIDYTRHIIAKLSEWEGKFYAVQQDAVRQVPKALAELQARLDKVLAETLPVEAHTVASGVKAEKPAATTVAQQEVNDVAGRVLAKVEDAPKPSAPPPAASPAAGKKAKAPPDGAPPPPRKAAPKPPDEPPPRKDAPEPPKDADHGPNTKKQDTLDPRVAAEREHVSQLSKAGKIEEARAYLREKVLDNPDIPPKDKPRALIDRLDVSSEKDKAFFWSGNLDAAKEKAAEVGGVTLETTTGGRVADGWGELQTRFPGWKGDPPPNGHNFWAGLSEKYAQGTSGNVNVVQSVERAAQGGGGIWKDTERFVLEQLQDQGVVGDIQYHVVPNPPKP